MLFATLSGFRVLGNDIMAAASVFSFNLCSRKVGSKGEVGKKKIRGVEILHYVETQDTVSHLAEAAVTGWKLQPSLYCFKCSWHVPTYQPNVM